LGDLVLLLNNDILVNESRWLDEMVSLAMGDDVGCVGPKLLYQDGSIQHAGVVVGLDGVAGHLYQGFPADHPGYCGTLQVRRAVSAVTGACLLVRSKLYSAVGGMDERLAVAYNDVDFCLRVQKAGFRNIYTPEATLFHHESSSRGFVQSDRQKRRHLGEQAYLRAKWGALLDADPYYNVNLSRRGDEFPDVRARH
jgi:GT2 family glycosyltransferase